MASHHFIGTGIVSGELRRESGDPDGLTARVSAMVATAGLSVVSSHAALFDGGGLTVVWILAESHLVLHVWAREGYATIDLHVCDYHDDNRARAGRLTAVLEAFCFAPGSTRWRSLAVEAPAAALAAER